MSEVTIFELGWVLLFATITGIASVRLKVPPVIGLLIAGMFIGPNVFKLVATSSINSFSQIGAVLLLFMIGVEFSVTKLLSKGLSSIISSVLRVLVRFLIIHQVAILLGFDPTASLYIAAMFSISSTAIMMKIIEQKKLSYRPEVPSLVTMLIIEDILAVFMLTFFSDIKTGFSSPEVIIQALLVSFAVLAFGYIILLTTLRKFLSSFLKYQAEDTLILSAFTLGVGMSVLAAALGLSPAIGAFLAGSIVAGLSNGKELENAIRPFSQVFSSFFFLSIGMFIDPLALVTAAGSTTVLILIFLITAFLTTAFSFFLTCSRGDSSIFAGLAMLSLGEFSLLIAQQSVGVVSVNLVGIVATAVLISSLISSYGVTRSEWLHRAFKRRVSWKTEKTVKDASYYFRNVVSAFEPNGSFNTLFVSQARTLAMQVIALVGAGGLYVLAKPFLQFPIQALGSSLWADNVLLLALLLLSILPVIRLLVCVQKLLDALSAIFSRTTPQATQVRMKRNLLVSVVFFLIFTNFSFIVDSLVLPNIFKWLAPIFALLSAFFLWSAIQAVSIGFLASKRNPVRIIRERIISYRKGSNGGSYYSN
ncbi:cation:proton antiporter, partial [Candidatus Micrarchaeota archaeon]|nr:cation:proton antiporter [Candidatus Micrarchaeota archaeon]